MRPECVEFSQEFLADSAPALHHVGDFMLFRQWLTLVATAAFCALPAAGNAQLRPMADIPNPTIRDADPGIDNTGRAAQVDNVYRPQPVFYRTHEAPGTIIVNTSDRFLYLVMGNNRAMRYGVGVGRDGFQWGGIHRITRKAEWPDWTPPEEMIARQPYLPRFMAGGPGNPMGARAMYIGATVYRIHGTNAPETIGHAVSSGCFRLVNDDVVDLYERVPVGTKIVVQHR
jgi:lipoprotein-anchoring transpeptidase ErfK/SrfK